MKNKLFISLIIVALLFLGYTKNSAAGPTQKELPHNLAIVEFP